MSIERLPEEQAVWNAKYNCPRFFNYLAKERRQKHEKLQVSYHGETWHTRSEYHYAFHNLIRDSHGYLSILDTTNSANDESRPLASQKLSPELGQPILPRNIAPPGTLGSRIRLSRPPQGILLRHFMLHQHEGIFGGRQDFDQHLGGAGD